MVNFGPQTKKLSVRMLTRTKLHFLTDFISARRASWPLKFLHALEIDQGMLAPPPRAALRWALPHISRFIMWKIGKVADQLQQLPRWMKKVVNFGPQTKKL